MVRQGLLIFDGQCLPSRSTCICNEPKIHGNFVRLHVCLNVGGIDLLHVVDALDVDPHVGAEDVDAGELWVALAVVARGWGATNQLFGRSGS